MKRDRLAFILSSVFCIFVLTFIFTSPVFSQEPTPSLFTEICIKPGMEYEFEKFMKDEVLPAFKKGEYGEMGVYKTAVFGEGTIYSMGSPITDLARFDEPHPVVKAIGPYGAQAMSAKISKFAKSVRNFIMNPVPDLEIPAAEGYSVKIGLQIKVTVAPGRDEEYEKNAKIMNEVLKKAKIKGFMAGRVGLGGNPNQYYFFALFDSFADMKAFGPALQKARSETKLPDETGIVQHVEYAMYSHVPELSIQAAAQ